MAGSKYSNRNGRIHIPCVECAKGRIWHQYHSSSYNANTDRVSHAAIVPENCLTRSQICKISWVRSKRSGSGQVLSEDTDNGYSCPRSCRETPPSGLRWVHHSKDERASGVDIRFDPPAAPREGPKGHRDSVDPISWAIVMGAFFHFDPRWGYCQSFLGSGNLGRLLSAPWFFQPVSWYLRWRRKS